MPTTVRQYEALAEELGAFAVSVRRELREAKATVLAEIRAEISALQKEAAEHRLVVAQLDQQIRERLASLRDGEPGPPGRDGIDGKDGRDGVDGKDGRDGVDGLPGERGADGAPGAPGERGPEGAPGKLPLVRAYEPGAVHYEAQVVVTDLGTFQAIRDTAQAPPHSDWLPLATSGSDGRSFNIRGTWSADEAYQRLDIVARNGGSFAAVRDNPGECPGPGWQQIAQPGKAGKPGDRGPSGQPGPKGDRGATPVRWQVEPENYCINPIFNDGTRGEPIDLRGLFEQFEMETH